MNENLALGLFALLPCFLAWGLRRFARKRKAGAAPNWRQLVAGNFLVLAFLLSLVLLGGEIYFRFIYDSTDALSYSKVSRRWFERYWHDNALMVRDNLEYSLRKVEGRRRITFIGDSFTAGHGIRNVEDRFVNIVRREHPEWEIHMLAQPGLDTGAELKNLITGLKHGYQVDHVVLVYCLNDISDIIPEWVKVSAALAEETGKSCWLRRSSFFVDWICVRWQTKRNVYLSGYFNFVAEAYRGPLWRTHQQRLRIFQEIVKANGGQLSVVTFPFMQSMEHYDFGFMHQQLAVLWKELNVPYLDLLPVFRDSATKSLTVNRFDAHPNETAHALAAAAISKFLASQMQTNRPGF